MAVGAGEPGQAFRRERQDNKLATECELLVNASRARVDLAGEQRGERVVAARQHRDEGTVEFPCDRDRTFGELARVAVAAVSRARRRRSRWREVGEEVDVADLVQHRGGPVDAPAKLRGVLGGPWLAPSRRSRPHRSSPAMLAQRSASSAKRLGDIPSRHRGCPRRWSAPGAPARRSVGSASALALLSASATIGARSARRPKRPRAQALQQSARTRGANGRRLPQIQCAGRSSRPRPRSGLASASSGRAPRHIASAGSASPGGPPSRARRGGCRSRRRAWRGAPCGSCPEQRPIGSVALGQREEVAVVALADGVVVGGGREALGGVGADRLEHPQPRGRVAPAGGARAGSWRRAGRACRGRRR